MITKSLINLSSTNQSAARWWHHWLRLNSTYLQQAEMHSHKVRHGGAVREDGGGVLVSDSDVNKKKHTFSHLAWEFFFHHKWLFVESWLKEMKQILKHCHSEISRSFFLDRQMIEGERTRLRVKDGFISKRRVPCNSCARGWCIKKNTQALNLKVTELNFIHMLFLILSCTDPNEKQHPNLLVLRNTVQKISSYWEEKKKKLECFSFIPLLNVFFFDCQSLNVWREKKYIKEMLGKTTARELLQLLIMEGICTK